MATWGLGLQLGGCLLMLILVCAVWASILLDQGAKVWRGFLGLGASSLLLALISWVLLWRMDALRSTIRGCPGCGLALGPYLLGGGVAAVAALILACIGCAVGCRIAWRRRWRLLAACLLLGLLLPPFALVGFVTGLVRPLIASEQDVARILVVQSLLVLTFGAFLRLSARQHQPGMTPEAPPTQAERAGEAHPEG